MADKPESKINSIDEVCKQQIDILYKVNDINSIHEKVKYWVQDSIFSKQGSESIKEYTSMRDLSSKQLGDYINQMEIDYCRHKLDKKNEPKPF